MENLGEIQKNLNKEINEEKKKIKNGKLDMSFGELANLYDEGDLIINPEFQRFFRWDKYQKTRLIESILVGLPMPSIFVVEDEEGRWEVIDGLQRLSTVFSFMDKNGFSKWKLDEGDILKEIKDLYYDDLPLRVKNIIRRYVFRVELIYQESDFNARYEIFERLNTGSSPLSDQEIRNAIYRPVSENFNNFLTRQGNNEEFVNLIRISENQLNILYADELVLRFCSLYDSENITKNLSTHLNLYMKEMASKTKEDTAAIDDLEDIFTRTIQLLIKLDEKNIFWRKKGGFSATLYDGIMVGVVKNIEKYDDNLELLKSKINELKNSSEFDDYSGLMSHDAKNVRGRIEIANNIFGSVE